MSRTKYTMLDTYCDTIESLSTISYYTSTPINVWMSQTYLCDTCHAISNIFFHNEENIFNCNYHHEKILTIR